MAHFSWFEADAHISWAYTEAGILVPDRVPSVLGGDQNPAESQRVAGYEHRDRIIERVGELAAASSFKPAYARWDAVYEIADVIVGHARLEDHHRLVADGILPESAVADLTPDILRVKPIVPPTTS